MKRWNAPIALYLFLVFVSGAVVGALGYRVYSPPSARATRISRDAWRKQYVNEMQTRINLTPDQMQKVNAILDDTDAKFTAAREEHDHIIEKIRDEHRAELRAIMTPEQLPKYEQFRADRDARSKAANKK